MNRLPREKLNQLLLTAAFTVLALGLIYFFLIRSQLSSIDGKKKQYASTEIQLKSIENTIKKSDDTTAELSEAVYNLSRAESDIASGDIYSWTYDFIRKFKATYRVEIPSITPPSLTSVDLLPNFPYRQIRVTLNGTAYYHDFGKFISDLENTFPHVRVVNLALEPANSSEAEKLAFRVDIIALVKSNP